MLSTLAVILLLPYFGWGIYALRLKYRFHEDLSLVTEACTLLGLVLFYVLEMALLRETLEREGLQYVVAALGLIASGAALYGHMAISFSSRLIVEAVVPGPDANDRRPRLGPAEALERRKDYEGALNEYYVIARMFPKDAQVPMRIAQLQIQLGHPADAVVWLRKAQKFAQGETQVLTVANRLVEVYDLHLKQPDAARAVITEFLHAYPDSNEGPMLRARLVMIGAERKGPSTEALNALAEAPLEEVKEPETETLVEAEVAPRPKSAKRPTTTIKRNSKPETSLAALDDAPVMADEYVTRHSIAERSEDAPAPSFSLDLIEDVGPITREEDEQPRTGPGLSLEPMDRDE